MEPEKIEPTSNSDSNFKIDKLTQESDRLLTSISESTTTVFGFVIMLAIPFAFNLLHIFGVLTLPLWVNISLWIVNSVFIIGLMTELYKIFTTRRKIDSTQNKIDILSGFKNTKEPLEYINELVEINVTRLDEYYNEVKRHTVYSFSFALIVGLVGFALIVVGIFLGYDGERLTTAYLAGISGILIEFISGVFFYLYNKTVKQLKLYHDNLIDLQNTLLSFQLIERVNKPSDKDAIISKIVDYLIGKQVASQIASLSTKKLEKNVDESKSE
jgi:hypothetical protein